MAHLSLTNIGSRGLFWLGLGMAWLSLVGPAGAADFDDERYGRPGGYYEPRVEPRVYERPAYPPPVLERRAEEELCRTVYRRRIDPYGHEVVHRLRVCDDGIVGREPRWAARDPRYGHGPRYEEQWGYDVPRPPRPVGPRYEEDLD